ncbi:unnamed protein product [Anisakis simplex]|uniref:EF-hand domain-containing protein n=1 Tax=Anisakis simplex TaxID=6269 RepID=A0A158PNV5_ANISI|nr:unnamed protein product [Anisakis simplex]
MLKPKTRDVAESSLHHFCITSWLLNAAKLAQRHNSGIVDCCGAASDETKMAKSESDHNLTRKKLESVVQGEIRRYVEACGHQLLNDDASWLTYKEWIKLGAVDCEMTSDVLNSYSKLLAAVRDEAIAKKRLKEATLNVSKTLMKTAETIHQMTDKYIEKCGEVKLRRMNIECQQTPITEDNTYDEEPSRSNIDDSYEQSKEKENIAKFNPFDVESVLAAEPVLCSKFGQQLMAETKIATKKSKLNQIMQLPPSPTLSQSFTSVNHYRYEKTVPDDIRKIKEEFEKMPSHVKFSMDGSIFCQDGDDTTVADLEPLTVPIFDDEESSQQNSSTSYHNYSGYATQREHSLNQQKQLESWMLLPKSPVLRSKAVIEYLSRAKNLPFKKITNISQCEYEQLPTFVRKQLAKDDLNELILFLNDQSESKSLSVTEIKRLVREQLSAPQSEVAIFALQLTRKIDD